MPNVVPHIMLNVVDALGNDQCNALGPVWLLVIISQLLFASQLLSIQSNCQQCPGWLSKPLSIKSYLCEEDECVSYREGRTSKVRGDECELRSGSVEAN